MPYVFGLREVPEASALGVLERSFVGLLNLGSCVTELCRGGLLLFLRFGDSRLGIRVNLILSLTVGKGCRLECLTEHIAELLQCVVDRLTSELSAEVDIVIGTWNAGYEPDLQAFFQRFKRFFDRLLLHCAESGDRRGHLHGTLRRCGRVCVL
jgi:hypothetical protein